MYTIYSMYYSGYVDVIKEIVLEMGWKILLKEDSKIFTKKLVGVDEFFIEISIINTNIINIKKFMKISVNQMKNQDLLSFINSINKNTFYGCYTLDEKEGYINFNYNLYVKNMNLKTINEIVGFLRSVIFELETLSKKISFGIHQILYSNYKIDKINQFVLIDTVGNA